MVILYSVLNLHASAGNTLRVLPPEVIEELRFKRGFVSTETEDTSIGTEKVKCKARFAIGISRSPSGGKILINSKGVMVGAGVGEGEGWVVGLILSNWMYTTTMTIRAMIIKSRYFLRKFFIDRKSPPGVARLR